MIFSKVLTFISDDTFTDKNGKKRRRIKFQDLDKQFVDFLVPLSADYNLESYTEYDCTLSLYKDKNYNLYLNLKEVSPCQ